jgi:Ferredoxin-dependent bilin reductase
MEALFRKTCVLFIILLEMSYFRSASAFSFLRPQSFTTAKFSSFSASTYGMQMTSERGTSAGSKFESWYQRTIKNLSMHEELIPIPLDCEFSSNCGSIGKSNVTFVSKAWQSKSMRYIRLVSFVGEGYDVFNFMAVPRSHLAIPILGIDIVSLPSECTMFRGIELLRLRFCISWLCFACVLILLRIG